MSRDDLTTKSRVTDEIRSILRSRDTARRHLNKRAYEFKNSNSMLRYFHSAGDHPELEIREAIRQNSPLRDEDNYRNFIAMISIQAKLKFHSPDMAASTVLAFAENIRQSSAFTNTQTEIFRKKIIDELAFPTGPMVAKLLRPILPRLKWSDKSNNEENPIKFIMDQYSEHIKLGMDQADLRLSDQQLYRSFYNYCKRKKIDPSTVLPRRYSRLPSELRDIDNISDPLHELFSEHERRKLRLYNALRRRQSRRRAVTADRDAV